MVEDLIKFKLRMSKISDNQSVFINDGTPWFINFDKEDTLEVNDFCVDIGFRWSSGSGPLSDGNRANRISCFTERKYLLWGKMKSGESKEDFFNKGTKWIKSKVGFGFGSVYTYYWTDGKLVFNSKVNIDDIGDNREFS